MTALLAVLAVWAASSVASLPVLMAFCRAAADGQTEMEA